jgi:ATP-dependent Clp protease ATP-binding subunit ClpA
MPDKFAKFTERARKVLTLAQEEAHGVRHPSIGTEHLLLGLVRQGDGGAARALADVGVVLNALTGMIAAGHGSRPNDDVRRVTGFPPASVADFAQRNAHAWALPAAHS